MVGRKSKNMKHVGFRMPLHVYEEYLMVAEARGVDLSAVFNWVLNDFRPLLLLKHAKHQAAMLQAVIENPQERATNGAGEDDLLVTLNELLRQMDGVANSLRKRIGGEERRLAG